MRFVLIALALGASGIVALLYGGDGRQTPSPVATQAERRHTEIPSNKVVMEENYRDALAKARASQTAINPLVRYRPTPGIEGRKALDEIYAGDLPLNVDSFQAVVRILSQNVSSDEKVALTRILGRLYQPDNPTGRNSEILFNLRSLASDPNKEVARSAAITYARTGYQVGAESFLEVAHIREVLSQDDYYGELAHMSPLFPAEIQPGILDKISKSKNFYAREIIADGITNRSMPIEAYSDAAKNSIQEILKSSEPDFPSATSMLPLTDAVRYANWLHASSLVEGKQKGEAASQIILNRLSDPAIDPRKIVSYFLSSEAAVLLASAQQNTQVANLVDSTTKYANQFPSNAMIQMAAQEIRARANRSVVKVR